MSRPSFSPDWSSAVKSLGERVRILEDVARKGRPHRLTDHTDVELQGAVNASALVRGEGAKWRPGSGGGAASYTLYDNAYDEVMAAGTNTHRVVWTAATVENQGSGCTIASGYNVVIPSAGVYSLSWTVNLYTLGADTGFESFIELPGMPNAVQRVGMRKKSVLDYAPGSMTLYLPAAQTVTLFTQNRSGVSSWGVLEPTLVVAGPL